MTGRQQQERITTPLVAEEIQSRASGTAETAPNPCLVYESMRESFAYLDSTLRFRYVNRKRARYLPVSPEEAIGQHCYAIHHGRATPCPDCPCQQAMDTGMPVECHRETPDGRLWLIRAYPLRMPDGQTNGVLQFASDLTDLAMLVDRDELLRAILLSSQHAVLVLRAVGDGPSQEADFECVLANPMAEALLGPCVGLRVSASHLGRATSNVLCLCRLVRDSGEPGSAEVTLELHGQTRCFSVNVVRHDRGVALSVADVTERRAAEAEVQQLRHAAAVGRNAGGLAHDLHNLLHVVGAHVELARLDLPPTHPARPELESAETLTRAAASLSRRLSAARTAAGWGHLSLHDAILSYRPVLDCVRLNAVLVLDLQADQDLVAGDQGEIEQLLLNLVMNARDAMPSGGQITIGTRVSCANGNELRVELAVADTGVGMTEEVRARIFEPLFTTKGPGRGTGLGLPTVLTIVRRHAGTIAVESKPGQGTVVRVSLPVWQTPAAIKDSSSSSRVPP